MNVATASEHPGLNTLGISFARTDLAVDGMVLPHSHPKASELFYVSSGAVIAGFIDTGNQLFQKILRPGEVFVFQRGLLHFCLNTGFEIATAFSVLNSQNPGVVGIAGAGSLAVYLASGKNDSSVNVYNSESDLNVSVNCEL